jgi:hypothetical protein
VNEKESPSKDTAFEALLLSLNYEKRLISSERLLFSLFLAYFRLRKSYRTGLLCQRFVSAFSQN